jgi:hypothetical protein
MQAIRQTSIEKKIPTSTVSLPRKISSTSLNIVCEVTTPTPYNLFLNSPQFDPNIEGSPPNMFMRNLHERMQSYHT